ncbi:MAG: hypothetical protein FWG57_08175 [Endomicrobia bacterium]|nr:hypothetical protein [Endomicrobiia bacterium]
MKKTLIVLLCMFLPICVSFAQTVETRKNYFGDTVTTYRDRNGNVTRTATESKDYFGNYVVTERYETDTRGNNRGYTYKIDDWGYAYKDYNDRYRNGHEKTYLKKSRARRK